MSCWAPSLECKHCVAELYRADATKLNDEAYVRNALSNAADLAGATLIDICTHAFDPQGITGFALLAESHISIHTWPECEFAAVDAFTCGDTTDPELACNYLATAFSARGHSVSVIERSSPKFLSKISV
ncbi:MAG: adenosylmethionine decarboxylase [Gammaproteobacteria bacterium]|nr:adenosylmethionine decarboxylase [Gammaproteobacteria bacterium]